MSLGRLAVFAVVCAVGVARADVITLTQTGTVGFPFSTVYTVDTYGYFGPPGGSLAGAAFSLTATYDSQYFTQVPCGMGCTGYVATSPNAATLSLTIGGVTQTPDLNAGSNLVFETSASNTSPFFQEVIGSIGVGFLAAEDPAYWLPLTGLTNLDFANLGFGTAQSETLALSVVTSVSTSMPSPSQVPEPGSLVLAATGVMAVCSMGWRRRSLPSTGRAAIRLKGPIPEVDPSRVG